MDLNILQQKLGYTFKDISLLENALTHSSYANEKQGKLPNNERLEFLGDSVLGFITADYLYRNNAGIPEGELTKLRASLVCEKSLHGYAKALVLSEHLIMGKGERQSGGHERPSILADAFEAVLAALYLDGGIEEARQYLYRIMSEDLSRKQPKSFKDYKTTLQEIIQKNPEERLSYVLISEEGPDHHKHFVSEVHLNSNVIGRGGGSSKKEAEQQAARQALELMGY